MSTNRRAILGLTASACALALAACGGSGGGGQEKAATATTQTKAQPCGPSGGPPGCAPTRPQPPPEPAEQPVTLTVNGEKRMVTLSKVNFAYCRRRTDVCAAIRGRNFERLSRNGKRAVLDARKRKQARLATEEAARERERQRQQSPPVPQPEPEGTSTG